MDVRKFPDGYEIKVYRKQDLIDTIDQNIVDKEIALDIINHCELAAANYISEGFKTAIPYIGTIGISDYATRMNSKETVDILSGARETLNKEEYILFKNRFLYEDKRKASFIKYYKYVTAMTITKHKNLYRELQKKYGTPYANLRMFALASITSLDNEYEILNYEE